MGLASWHLKATIWSKVLEIKYMEGGNSLWKLCSQPCWQQVVYFNEGHAEARREIPLPVGLDGDRRSEVSEVSEAESARGARKAMLCKQKVGFHAWMIKSQRNIWIRNMCKFKPETLFSFMMFWGDTMHQWYEKRIKENQTGEMTFVTK